MAQLKAHEADRYLASPKHNLILLYGPDTGLVSERAAMLVSGSGVDPDDPFSAVRLDADEVAQDPQRLADEALTVPMFGGRRLVHVKGSTQRNLAKAVTPLASAEFDALVIVEAGDLKPTSGLRKAVESGSSAVAVPCYADEGASLDRMIDEEMRKASLEIDPDARVALKQELGADRMASRAEVTKLTLYAHGSGTVGIDDVEAIVGDASKASTDRLVDSAALGDRDEAVDELGSLLGDGQSAVALALALQRHFQMLHRVRAQMDGTGADAGRVVGSMRPPVNYKRRDVVVRALGQWSEPALRQALSRISALNLQVRKHGQMADALLGTAVLALVSQRRR